MRWWFFLCFFPLECRPRDLYAFSLDVGNHFQRGFRLSEIYLAFLWTVSRRCSLVTWSPDLGEVAGEPTLPSKIKSKLHILFAIVDGVLSFASRQSGWRGLNPLRWVDNALLLCLSLKGCRKRCMCVLFGGRGSRGRGGGEQVFTKLADGDVARSLT